MKKKDLENMNKDYIWKSSLGIDGGVHLIENLPNDSDYCLDCLYFGYIESI